MNTISIRQRGPQTLLLFVLLAAPAAPAQTASPLPAARVPIRRLRPAAATAAAVPRAPASEAADTNSPAASRPADTDLARAIATMNFDRTPDALLEVARSSPSGSALPAADRFRLAVLLGDWAHVGETLKTLPPGDAVVAYTRLLESLAANSQSAGQFFRQVTPPRGTPVVRDAAGNVQSQSPSTARDKRALFLSDDFYAVIGAAPAELTATHLPSLTALVQVAIGPAGRQDFLARLARGLRGVGGGTPSGRRLAAQLLSALGWIADAGPYLPLAREGWDAADTLTLVLTLEHFTQTGIRERDERRLKQAAELCAYMMQTSRFSANDRGLFKQATDRLVTLLPALEADEAGQLIRENFLTQPEIMVDLILAIGESGARTLKSADLEARRRGLETASRMLRVLERKKSALPPAVNMLVMNWLGEAEQTCRYGVTAATGAVADPSNPFIIYRPPSTTARSTVKTLSPAILLTQAPSATIIRRLNRGLAQRVNLTLLKVNLIDPKESITLETLQNYLREHPGQEKELCQDYLAAWVRQRTVAAEDPNIIRMRSLGYTISRQKADGIPLTRLRQNRNVRELKSLLASLRKLSPEPLDATAVIQSFMAIHSGAEVYQLEDIEAIFGPPEHMDRQELMGLVTGMRTKLRGQWQDARQQQDAGTNRTETETKDEVSRGYRTALELVRRGLRPDEAEWRQFLVRGQLFFDAAEYEFTRQIQLTEYVSLRDEAFGSYRKAAAIYAATLPEKPRGQWTIEPYQMWFFVMLGASDLSQLTRAAARSDPGLAQIGQAMRALPDDAAARHLQLFGQMLGDLLPQVPPNMRQRFLSAGLQVVGDKEPSAQAAVEALTNYQELLDEVQLRLAVDGPTRVGHAHPFGAFLSLHHTRQLARESGGFSKYLQNLASQRGYSSVILRSGGQTALNYRDEFAKNIHAALDETFEIASITFHDPSVSPIDLPREGWQETPLAYLVLRAKDAAVDRIPSLQLDMDFSDTSGQVVLPVRSQVQPLDARDTNAPPRPCGNLTLTMTLDEREWSDGRVVVEIAAKGHGIIPSHPQLFEFARDGFDVEATDHGLSVAQVVSDGHRVTAQGDRSWQFTYRRRRDLRGDVTFLFPAIKPGIPTASVEYKHYQDADLVTLEPARAAAGVALQSPASRALHYGVLALVLLALAAAAVVFVRLRKRRGPEAAAGLAIPAPLTPFSLAAFLRRLQREAARKLDANAHAALQAQIRDIEAAFFKATPPAAGAPDLETVAHNWLRAVQEARP
ncbi:MAG: hypothetical protein JXQ71_13720 [Verrucomicrobia bacterium]|nr:hypothetical protein [Verrucomicrobiota bacterium]